MKPLYDKISSSTCFLCALQSNVMAQTSLPIDTINGKDPSKPLVFYITGDVGFNSFSTSFIQEWNGKGYPVIALDAKSYFWKTKQPAKAANDVTVLLSEYMTRWNRNEVILAGYSLGADVLSFIQTRLPVTLANKIKYTVLLSPSKTTDFTVHLFYNSSGVNVPAEINKLSKPVLVIFGKEETDTPATSINNKIGCHYYGSRRSSLHNQVAFLINEIVKRM